MASPINPPQDIHDLDALTRMAIKLRAERGKAKWPHWTDAFSLIIGAGFGVILWRMNSSDGPFLAYIAALLVMLGFHSESQRRANERLERLEEGLSLLTEEIAKRQRAADTQLDSLRPTSS